MVLLQRKEKTILFQGSRGGPTISKCVCVGGGVQMLISIETHITCDFPGGGGRGGNWIRTCFVANSGPN